MDEKTFLDERNGVGLLSVTVTTAQNLIPIEGAYVTVLSVDENGAASLVYAVKTDASGQTGKLALPAPPRAASMSPGQARPYALYNVQVDHPGFQSTNAVDLTIFEGVTADLPVYLLPLPAGETQSPAAEPNVLPPHSLNEEG